MFVILLGALLAAAALHLALLGQERTRRRAGELALVYLLVGYCGVPMLVLSLTGLLAPGTAVELFGIPGRNTQGFVALASLGMASAAVLSLRYRGTFLIGPAVSWAVVLGGGMFFHLHEEAALLYIFATHGLVALLLLGALLWSGVIGIDPAAPGSIQADPGGPGYGTTGP